MAGTIRNGDDDFEGVEFIHENDGSITAHNTETGLARGDDTRAEAPSQLTEILILYEGGDGPVTDDDLGELGLDPDEFGNREPSDSIQ